MNPEESAKEVEKPLLIYVSGLLDGAFEVNEKDIKKFFSPFGDIEFIEVERSSDGKCKGKAYISYIKKKDGMEAISKMNNAEVRGIRLKVGVADENELSKKNSVRTHNDEEDQHYINSATSRGQLMQKLTHENPLTLMMGGNTNDLNIQGNPTCCVLLTNLFDPSQIDKAKEPNYFTDLRDDVMDECSCFGAVETVWIEESSMGNVWVKFSHNNIEAARNAMQKLNGRLYGGRKIAVTFVPETVFSSKVK